MLARSDFDSAKPSSLSFVKESSFNDEVLLNSFKKGNELALSMLYKKYVQRLYDYGMHTCKDHDLVLDSLQELFLRLWTKRETVANIQTVKPYLYKAFRRHLVQQLIENKKLLARRSELAISFELSASIESTLIEDEFKADRIRRVQACLKLLTKGQREVIYLKFFNELSYREIADITEMQVPSVYNLVSKAIDLLRKKLQITRPSPAVRA